MRPSWKAYLKLSLVTIPVQAYTTADSRNDISLNQLHRECNSRIKYQKVCPIHGEVSPDEIVSGYEYEKGQYVVIEERDLEKVQTQRDQSIDIAAVIPAGSLDPRYFNGKSYYLLPDGDRASKPYALVQSVLREQKFEAVGTAAVHGREQLFLVRAGKKLIELVGLSYADQVKSPELLEPEAPEADAEPEEKKLATDLLRAFVKKKFDLAAFKDHRQEQMREIVEAKVEGREVIQPPQTEERPVINLMAALRASVAKAKPESKSAATQKSVARKIAPKGAEKRRKSG